MLSEHLFVVRLVVLVLVLFGTLFAAFALQRMYYCRKSSKCDSVERSKFRPVEALMMLVGLCVVFSAFTGWRTVRNLLALDEQHWSYFLALEPGERIKEFEIAEADDVGLTVLVYPTSDMGVRTDLPEEEWLQTQGDALEVTVEIVTFHSPLEMLGQPPLVRVKSLRGVGGDEEFAALSQREVSSRVFLDQLFKSSTREFVLRTRGPLASGDLFVLTVNADGTPSLQRHEDTKESEPLLMR